MGLERKNLYSETDPNMAHYAYKVNVLYMNVIKHHDYNRISYSTVKDHHHDINLYFTTIPFFCKIFSSFGFNLSNIFLVLTFTLSIIPKTRHQFNFTNSELLKGHLLR